MNQTTTIIVGAGLAGPMLVLDGDRSGPVDNLVVMSETAPDSAPPGRALISATVLGVPNRDTLEADVRRQPESWFGAQVGRWRHLRTYAVERALPDQRPPPPPVPSPLLARGVYVFGDHRRDGSINGAMASGRDAARALIDDFTGAAS